MICILICDNMQVLIASTMAREGLRGKSQVSALHVASRAFVQRYGYFKIQNRKLATMSVIMSGAKPVIVLVRLKCDTQMISEDILFQI